jgi:hypothetical protein
MLLCEPPKKCTLVVVYITMIGEMHQVPMQHIVFNFFAFNLIIEMNHFIENQSYTLEPHET